MRRIAVQLTLILACVSSFASTVSFTVHLQSYSSNPVHSYMIVTLKVPGVCIPTSLTGAVGIGSERHDPASGSGDVLLSLVPSGEISCATVPNTTWYQFDVWQHGVNGASDTKVYTATYQIAAGFDITTAPEYNVAVPPINANYAIRNGNNNYVGIQDFSLATVIGLLPLQFADISFNVESPATADTGKFQHKLNYSGHFVRLSCSTDTATVTINIDVRAEATPNTVGTSILITPLVCTTTTASVSVFDSPNFTGNAPLALLITGTTGANVVRIHARVSQ